MARFALLLVFLTSWGWVACQPATKPSPAVLPPTLTLLPATLPPLPSFTAPAIGSARPIDPRALPTYTPVPDLFLPVEARLAVQAILADAGASIQFPETLRLIGLKQVGWQGDLTCQTALTNPRPNQPIAYRAVLWNTVEVYTYLATAEGIVLLCPDVSPVVPFGQPLFFDPSSESLVELARQDLTRRLRLGTNAISWVDLMAITWPDTSLGCPVAGASYSQVSVDGYWIALSVDGQIFNYHADGISVQFCPSAQSILPFPFDSASDIPAS